jgi:hypothetical protein
MGLPMFRPFCKSIYMKECNVESTSYCFGYVQSIVSIYVLSRSLVQAM